MTSTMDNWQYLILTYIIWSDLQLCMHNVLCSSWSKWYFCQYGSLNTTTMPFKTNKTHNLRLSDCWLCDCHFPTGYHPLCCHHRMVTRVLQFWHSCTTKCIQHYQQARGSNCNWDACPQRSSLTGSYMDIYIY